MWKQGDPDRRRRPRSVASDDLRRLQELWEARERAREVRRIRDDHHDAHAKTIPTPSASQS